MSKIPESKSTRKQKILNFIEKNRVLLLSVGIVAAMALILHLYVMPPRELYIYLFSLYGVCIAAAAFVGRMTDRMGGMG